MRYAIYFTPAQDDPLTLAASAWLGRDAFTGAELATPDIAGFGAGEIEQLAAEPRRYGFHATIVAPFHPGQNATEQDLIKSFERFCDQATRFDIDGLGIAGLDGFIALMPTEAEPELSALAAEAVNHFAPLRAPLTPEDIARRDPTRLSLRQRSYLERYGYPYVMDEFRFHMTLTSRVPDDTAARVKPLLRQHFAPVTAGPITIGGLALFIEPEPGAAFTVHTYRRLNTHDVRKSA